MRRVSIVLSLWAVVFYFTGCATLQVDKPAVKALRKVAVVGFVVQQEEAEGWSFGAGDDAGLQWGPGLARAEKNATAIYENVRGALQRRFKWKVLGNEVLSRNKTYAQLFDDNMKGLQSRPPMPKGFNALGAEGVMDPWPIERLSAEERKALAKALGVQALAVVRVKIELEMGGGLGRLVGVGEYKPQATTQFTLYGKDGDEPVWRDLGAAGKAVEKGTEHVLGITSTDALAAQSIEAANKSFTQLIARYEKGP